MIQLEQQQHGEFVCGVVGGWLTPTTYIQLAGAGSKIVYWEATKHEMCPMDTYNIIISIELLSGPLLII